MRNVSVMLLAATVGCLDKPGAPEVEGVPYSEYTPASPAQPAPTSPTPVPVEPGPVPVEPTPDEAVQPDPRAERLRLAAGGSHACALLSSGKLLCWGANQAFELGVPDASTSGPVSVPFPRDSGGWTDVAAGNTHTCGLLSGKVYCWGYNAEDQTGTGVGVPVVKEPTAIPLAFTVSHLSADGSFTCAHGDASWRGMTRCWGKLDVDEIKHLSARTDPFELQGEALWHKIVGESGFDQDGAHFCALAKSKQLYCWGKNWAGQLGNGVLGDSVKRADAAKVQGGHKFIDVATSKSNTCGITNRHELLCWGGSSSVLVQATPEPRRLVDATGWVEVDMGPDHACARKRDGSVWCWGRNQQGATGVSTEVVTTPTQVRELRAQGVYAKLAASEQFTCAAGVNKVRCWGANERALLGDGLSW